MNAIIFDIKRFAVHDGDGIRTTVFFKGCPLRCLWCHNPEGLSGKPQLSFDQERCLSCGRCAAVCPTGAHRMEEQILKEPGRSLHTLDRTLCTACGKCAEICSGHALRIYGKEISHDELVPILLAEREYYVQSGGGVTLSGGEPLLQADFCARLLETLKTEQIHTAVDTCGLVERAAIEKIMPYTDIFLFDVKAAGSDLHQKLTGHGNQQILDNLRFIDASGKAIEIRIPLIPGGNDSEMERIGALLGELTHITKVKVLPYHRYYVPKYSALGFENRLTETGPPDTEHVTEAVEQLKRFGLNAVNGNE